jgi:hypothetical protein
MEFLIGLAVAFVKALVSSAGTAAGSKLVEAAFPKFEASGQQAVLRRLEVSPTAADESYAQQILLQQMNNDPMFAQQTQLVLQTAAPQFLIFAERVSEYARKNPDVAKSMAAADKMNFFRPPVDWPKFEL